MKFSPVGAALFQVDGETDRPTDRCDEANGRFLQFLERA